MILRTLTNADLTNKTVLVRADLNVPLTRDGKVADNSRIKAIVPTVKYLQDQKAHIILCSHLGRPKGKPSSELSLQRIIPELGQILKTHIEFCPKNDPKQVGKTFTAQPNTIVLLENTRFHPGEKNNDPEFAQELASLADVYVNDAFGTAHRGHASTLGVTEHLPSYAGLLLETEINAMAHLRDKINHRPLTVIVGGAKIDTKIGILKSFTDRADNLLIGGALANTFLEAAGYDIGESKSESDKLDLAREIMLLAEKHHDRLLIPQDCIVADEVQAETETCDLPPSDVEGNMKILDIGHNTIAQYCEIIKNAGTIIWNGPMGLYELLPFQNGTHEIAKAIATSNAETYIGGGDTIDACHKLKIDIKHFTHVSTGGGAMIEFLEGKELPALTPLLA